MLVDCNGFTQDVVALGVDLIQKEDSVNNYGNLNFNTSKNPYQKSIDLGSIIRTFPLLAKPSIAKQFHFAFKASLIRFISRQRRGMNPLPVN